MGKHKNLIPYYKFLLKEQHANYPIENKCYLINSLFEASVIEFYGFGFTKPDVPYIKDWLTTKPTFTTKRDVIIHIRKIDKDNIINKMKGIAGSNWKDFISHYSIKFGFEDKSEISYIEKML